MCDKINTTLSLSLSVLVILPDGDFEERRFEVLTGYSWADA